MQKSLAVIILTKNEEANLDRCLASLASLDCDVFVVDSGSTDRTLEIAAEYGAHILRHPWKNYSDQMNWAIANLQSSSKWVLRLDADEYLTQRLADEIRATLPTAQLSCSGFYVKRRFMFLGKWMKHGGMYPLWHLRIWRKGTARCEERWMDEHMVLVSGIAQKLNGDLVDDNEKDLTFWIEKHNHYSNREALDLLAIAARQNGENQLTGQAARKRWVKESLYSRGPLFFRAFAYWTFRYFLQFGFLDGREGLIFHFLHAFWYRFLVDAKIMERDFLARYSNRKDGELITAASATQQ